MPPTRVLAREFGMSGNALVDAYGALATMDWIARRHRSIMGVLWTTRGSPASSSEAALRLAPYRRTS
jgi:DNA-binding FadR family transcriptional regulator